MLSALGEVSLSSLFTLLWFSVSIVLYYPVAILVWLVAIVPIVVHYKLARFLAQTDEQIAWVPIISVGTWLAIIVLIAGVFAGAFAGLASPGAGM